MGNKMWIHSKIHTIFAAFTWNQRGWFYPPAEWTAFPPASSMVLSTRLCQCPAFLKQQSNTGGYLANPKLQYLRAATAQRTDVSLFWAICESPSCFPHQTETQRSPSFISPGTPAVQVLLHLFAFRGTITRTFTREWAPHALIGGLLSEQVQECRVTHTTSHCLFWWIKTTISPSPNYQQPFRSTTCSFKPAFLVLPNSLDSKKVGSATLRATPIGSENWAPSTNSCSVKANHH